MACVDPVFPSRTLMPHRDRSRDFTPDTPVRLVHHGTDRSGTDDCGYRLEPVCDAGCYRAARRFMYRRGAVTD